MPAAHWVHHDGVGYVLPAKGPVSLENNARTGSWQRVHQSVSPTPLSRDIFTLWLEHGTRPNDESYSYIVVPKASASEVASYAASSPIRVLVDAGALQGGRHDPMRATGVVFHQAGNLFLHPGLAVEANKPCVVVVDEAQAAPNVRWPTPPPG